MRKERGALSRPIGRGKKERGGPDSSCRGFTLIEATLSILIVGGLLVASLRVVATAKIEEAHYSDLRCGKLLASGLLAEIMAQSYQNATAPVFGPESGETRRSLYNDVDDYNGWTESPPQNNDGTTIPNLTAWTRSVKVEWVTASSLTGAASSTETGAKRITVTVSKNGAAVATAVGIRTNAP